MLLSPPALVVDPILSENRRKRSTLAPIVSNVSLKAKPCPSHMAKSCAKLRKPISRNHCPTRRTRPTRPTLLSAKREAQSLALHCSLQSAKLCEMGLCAPCRGAPAVVVFDSVVKDQLWLCHWHPEGLGADSWSRSNFTPRRNHMPPHKQSAKQGVRSTKTF